MMDNPRMSRRDYLIVGLVLLFGFSLCTLAGLFFMSSAGKPGEAYPFPSQIGLTDPSSPSQAILGITPTPEAAITRVTSKALPTRPDPSSSPTPSPESEIPPTASASLDSSEDTLDVLRDTLVPISDLYDLARRLEGKMDIPTVYPAPEVPPQIGDRQAFWVLNTDTNQPFQATARLRYITDHLYFWVQEGVPYNRDDLQNLAESFEKQIYPTSRAFFGGEWTPGVDSDPHIYALYVKDMGASVAGFFSTVDEYSPLVHEYSNAHELFLLHADRLKLGGESAYHVLAHEFQHMIHWYRDRNEMAWLNEGFSELAALINGYMGSNFAGNYAADPDIQLNDWPAEPALKYAHYGASFLFATYILDRFGAEVTQALAGEQENGLESLDNVLAEMGVTDPLTGKIIGADDVFIDWAVANYLQEPGVVDGRYTYHIYSDVPQPEEAESVWKCPQEKLPRQVHQYGVDYIRIICPGEYTLHFEGLQSVKLLSQDPYSGSYALWSNQGDESDMTLTRMFDFTAYSGPLTLSYQAWYDLEKDYDYVYLEASLDGVNWQILNTPSGTAEDPSGNSYGWGYNGVSGGGPQWIREQVNLSQFAGQMVALRFEYVTDTTVHGEGFILDDVAIPEAGYWSDFELNDGGWQGNGFVRVQNVLPQTFRLALIKKGLTTTVEYVLLAPDGTADIPLSIGEDITEVILVVSGTTRFTRQKAGYWLEITGDLT